MALTFIYHLNDKKMWIEWPLEWQSHWFKSHKTFSKIPPLNYGNDSKGLSSRQSLPKSRANSAEHV